MDEKTYGYIRVSTREQNEDRQLIALQEFPIPARRIFMDKMSGKDFQRAPNTKHLLRLLKPRKHPGSQKHRPPGAETIRRFWSSGAF